MAGKNRHHKCFVNEKTDVWFAFRVEIETSSNPNEGVRISWENPQGSSQKTSRGIDGSQIMLNNGHGVVKKKQLPREWLMLIYFNTFHQKAGLGALR